MRFSGVLAERKGARSCEKINNLTQRRQGAKTRKEQLFCFLCVFYDFAPWREMLLLFQVLFHSFAAFQVRSFYPVSRRGIARGHSGAEGVARGADFSAEPDQLMS